MRRRKPRDREQLEHRLARQRLRPESLVRPPRCCELVQLHASLEILLRDPREVAPRRRVAVARAHEALLAHERAPAEGDVLVDVHLAEPYDLAARPNNFSRQAKR